MRPIRSARVVYSRSNALLRHQHSATSDLPIYTATVTVTCTGHVTQKPTITVDQQQVFKSKSKCTATTGSGIAFPVTTLYGYPAPAITKHRTLSTYA